MIYLWHHIAALALAAAAGAVLLRARWPHHRPGTALLLWHCIAFGAVTAVVGGLLTVGLLPYRQGILPALAQLLTGTVPVGFTAVHLVAVIAGFALAAALVAAQLASAWRNHRSRTRHRLLLDLVARPADGREALVVNHPATTAYHLPGRDGCVVLSTGALTALAPAELDAVMAHEFAHARERHHLLLTPFRLMQQLVCTRPARRVAEHVELLVEMRADDQAARRHGADTLAAALTRFQHSAAAPPGTLAIATTATSIRIRRLQSFPTRVSPALHAAAFSAAATIATTPLSLYLLPA